MTGSPLWMGGRGVELAVVELRLGRVVGFPTDTVYGLAALAANPSAVAALARVKGRSSRQPVIAMAATAGELEVLAVFGGQARVLADRFWPGPLTLILPARSHVAGLTYRGTVAVRVPSHVVALELLSRAGPLATTSANRHGEPPAHDAADALHRLHGLAGALAAPAAPEESGQPSSILDLTRAEPVLIREGGLSAHQLGVSVTRQDPRIRRD
ncbi:MAG TPA: L-threonylcarbamoyladenylate synthase [Candidatus Dormibacteraeota bacterium]|nr:L-threonylcarbamoyladenylate synthase [Candidatus Dormibacteraeota bacterium]